MKSSAFSRSSAGSALLAVLASCAGGPFPAQRSGDPTVDGAAAGAPPASGEESRAGDTRGEDRSGAGARLAEEPRLLGPAPWPADEGRGVESNGGRYWVVVLPSRREIPLNEEFDVELRVFDGETRSRRVDAELTVDARMPAHGHGMKLDPAPVENPDGSYTVPGMLLHMVGHWELYVDLTVGPFTERAQFDIELE